MAAVSPARNAAFRILLAVERGEAHSDDLLRAKSVSALAPADRNLSTTLVLGVLRWQIALDQRIKKNLAKPNAKLDAEVRIALRLGAFQLLHLDRIPAHAALDESVELVKRAGHRFAAGMVNAVLRKLAASTQKAPEWKEHQDEHEVSGHDFNRAEKGQEESGASAPETAAYPAWLLDRWTRAYGSAAACSICRHGQQQPALSIRLSDPAAEAELQAQGIELAPGALLAFARTVLSGDVTATAAFRAGRVRIQDEGSQLIAEIAASAGTNLLQKTRSILDACAAPGGKTLILAERHPEARILACEASPQRLAQLKERLSILGERMECRLADASALQEDGSFDLALADVPCSGTGTLGRNPEIRHRLQPPDLPRQAERQQAILRAALRAVRPGGRVVYSTCSLEPEENEQVVAAVLAAGPAARQLPIKSLLESMRQAGTLTAEGVAQLMHCVTAEGALRLLPGAVGTDGFFAAVLERVD
ncbi:MAG: transcription antitermination factor NusB [Acidobacteriota bacterium]